jgi:hypothetical protein
MLTVNVTPAPVATPSPTTTPRANSILTRAVIDYNRQLKGLNVVFDPVAIATPILIFLSKHRLPTQAPLK